MEKEVPGRTADEFKPFLAEEAERVWQLYQEGTIRELYFRSDADEAVLMPECSDTAHAERVLSGLPLVREKLITFELVPLKAYPGFARLFA